MGSFVEGACELNKKKSGLNDRPLGASDMRNAAVSTSCRFSSASTHPQEFVKELQLFLFD